MTIKPLIILPDPLLRQVSAPIERVDAELEQFIDDMLETMYDAPGIGLAAIQVGVPRRLLVIDLTKEDEERKPLVFINPEILTSSDDRSSTRRAASRSRINMPRSSALLRSPLSRSAATARTTDGSRRPARDLPSARDRPSQWRSFHRSHLAPEAGNGDQEVHQGRSSENLIRASANPRFEAATMALRIIFMARRTFP